MVSVMTNFMYRCGGIGSHDNAVKNSYVFTPVKIFPNIRIFAQSVISYLMGKKKKLHIPDIFSSDNLDSPITWKYQIRKTCILSNIIIRNSGND